MFTVLALVGLLVAGGTMAWFTAETDEVNNAFAAGTVEIEMWENDNLVDGDLLGMNIENVNPGDCYIKKVVVKNTGSKKAMVRVHESTVIEDYNLLQIDGVGDPNIAIVKFAANPKWVYEDNYFYYNEVLQLGAETEPILVENKICFDGPLMGNEYQGAKFTITLKADAIQATNGAPTAEGWKFDPLAAVE